jgi:hypothetical protein
MASIPPSTEDSSIRFDRHLYISNASRVTRHDTFSSDLRGVSEESFTSTGNGTSRFAHGDQVAPSGRPLGGANLYSVIIQTDGSTLPRYFCSGIHSLQVTKYHEKNQAQLICW